MTTVKLDLISAKAQQAAGKSGKSERADNGLFTEVFSTKLSGSRTTTAADDRSSSAAKDKVEGAAKDAVQADYEDGNSIDAEQNDLQEAAEPEDDSAEKAAMMPAWLLMQLEQDSGNSEVKAVSTIGVEAVADPVMVPAEVVTTMDLEAVGDVEAVIAEDAMSAEAVLQLDGNQLAKTESVQNIVSAAGDVLTEAAAPINEAGREIIDSKVLPEQEMTAADMDLQQTVAAENAADIDGVTIGKSNTVVDSQELTAAESTRLNIQDASAEETEATSNTGAEADIVQEENRLLDNLKSTADGNRQPGQEKENDNNGSAFAQMIRGEAVRQDSGTVDNTSATGMYSAEVEVRDVGQFGRQLIERIDLRQLDQSQQLTIRLRPDEFGSLTIRLTRSPEGLLAQLISDTAVTREMLAQQANDLQQALKDQGFDIVQTEILSDFADQQQDSKSFDSWQQLQEGRDFSIRTADAAARLSAQMLEQDESQQRIERYTTGSVDYFA